MQERVNTVYLSGYGYYLSVGKLQLVRRDILLLAAYAKLEFFGNKAAVFKLVNKPFYEQPEIFRYISELYHEALCPVAAAANAFDKAGNIFFYKLVKLIITAAFQSVYALITYYIFKNIVFFDISDLI